MHVCMAKVSSSNLNMCICMKLHTNACNYQISKFCMCVTTCNLHALSKYYTNTASDFSLAERNEISEKCFSHTPLGPGYRSCDLSGGQLFLLRPPLLTLLRFFDKNTLAS